MKDFKRSRVNTVYGLELKCLDLLPGKQFGQLEAVLQNASYNNESPLWRCFQQEVPFDGVGYFERDTDGFPVLRCKPNDVFLLVIACHPHSSVRQGILRLKFHLKDFSQILQDAFLSYLTYCKSGTFVYSRFADDPRLEGLFLRSDL